MEVKNHLEHNFRGVENIKVTTKDKLKINVRFWQAAEATVLILLTIIIDLIRPQYECINVTRL